MPAEPVWFEADENQIRQIVWNLATNGLRAMAARRPARLLSTPERSRRQTADVVLAVEDQGCGIAPDDLDGIFQPFRSTFEKGTGLGLATVHRIVTDYSGEIQVLLTSARGRDARASCRSRAGRSAAAPAESRVTERGRMTASYRRRRQRPQRPASAAERRPSRRILVVDDEPSMRDMLRIVLRRDGYDVQVAANGRAAHRHAQARARSICCCRTSGCPTSAASRCCARPRTSTATSSRS